MKVILTKDVQGLGRIGDVKEVNDGHAKNYLLPKHFALPATSQILSQIQKQESEKQAKLKNQEERFNEFRNKIDHKKITIKGKTEGQNLFAAIHEKQIAKVLSDKFGFEISPQAIMLKEPLKSLGQYEVEIRLAQHITASVVLQIEKE